MFIKCPNVAIVDVYDWRPSSFSTSKISHATENGGLCSENTKLVFNLPDIAIFLGLQAKSNRAEYRIKIFRISYLETS